MSWLPTTTQDGVTARALAPITANFTGLLSALNRLLVTSPDRERA
jgi:hypothetical protein